MTKRVRKKKSNKPKANVLAEGWHAIASVDPGGTTGLFCAAVEIKPTMKETVAGIGFVEFEQITGDFRFQAWELCEKIHHWFASVAIDGVAPANHHIVFENWDTGRAKVGRELISVWVMAAADVLLLGEMNGPIQPDQISYQYASAAKGYARNDKLKRWGLYDLTKGKPHARDASRHWATKVNHLVG